MLEKKKKKKLHKPLSEAVTSEMPGVAELRSLGCSSTVHIVKQKKQWHTTPSLKYSMLIFQMHIFKQQLQRFINGQCITSEKNTV